MSLVGSRYLWVIRDKHGRYVDPKRMWTTKFRRARLFTRIQNAEWSLARCKQVLKDDHLYLAKVKCTILGEELG
mgnify:CR=1 FL=1